MSERQDARSSTRWWLRHDSHSIVIEAPAGQIYPLVADLSRMGEWSPECRQVEWLQGSTGPAVGARFIGHNKGGPAGLMKWSRQGRVLRAEPAREFAFATEEGGKEGVEWRYRFEPVDGGTRVTESYEVHWIPTWARILDIPTNRAGELRRHMRQTLEELKHVAETATAIQ